jgi:hypothetical protein
MVRKIAGVHGGAALEASPRAVPDVEVPEPDDNVPNGVSPPEPGVVLVDGMMSGTNAVDGPGLTGYWYTYSDRTAAIHPSEGAELYPPTTYLGRPAREFTGGGESNWGAGFGFDLNDAVPAGAGPNAKVVSSPFDASEYAGVRFEAISKRRPIGMTVTFSDVDTNARGGVCDASSPDPAKECNGDFEYQTTFSTSTWEQRTVLFSQLVLPPWTRLPSSRKNGFRKDKVYSIHFQINTSSAGKPLPSFDVLVADVYFIKNDTSAAAP